jgi:hypothetical protein
MYDDFDLLNMIHISNFSPQSHYSYVSALKKYYKKALTGKSGLLVV